MEQDWDRFPSVKFSAIVTGHPAPSVTWYLNDTPIVSSDAIRVKPLEPETGKTSIRIIKPRTDQVCNCCSTELTNELTKPSNNLART